MIDFLHFLLTAIGTISVICGITFGLTFAWCSLSEAAERKRKATESVLALLEKIEANTAKAEITPDSDPA